MVLSIFYFENLICRNSNEVNQIEPEQVETNYRRPPDFTTTLLSFLFHRQDEDPPPPESKDALPVQPWP